MQRPRIQFTIRTLMIAVVVVAGLLALPPGYREVAVALSLPCLALSASWRLLQGGHRRLAAIGFWGLAIPANVVFAFLCASPGMLSLGLFFLWLLIILPTLAGFGATWASLAARPGAGPHPVRRRAGTWVTVLALMPGVTSWTVWPFWLEFLIARPVLERVADQVEAGQAVAFPLDAGPFRIVASRVGSRTEGVALLTDPNPNGPSGFVRHKVWLGGPFDCYDPIRGDWWHVGLGGGWCYHEED